MEKFQLKRDEAGSAKYGMKLYRIVALRDVGDVKAGEEGGLVSSGDSLSNEGSCWVGRDAAVLEYAKVKNDAVVRGNAVICGSVTVQDEAVVEESARIYNQAVIEGRARVSGSAVVAGRAVIQGEAVVRGKAHLTGDTVVGGTVCIEDEAILQDEKSEKPKQEMKPTKKQVEEMKERRQYLEFEYHDCKNTVTYNKRGGIAATAVTAVVTSLIVIFGFGGVLLATTVLVDVLSLYITIFCFANSIIGNSEVKRLEQELLRLSKVGEMKFSLEDFCTELRDLNDKISNQELHGFVMELVQVLAESKEYKDSLPETHLEEAVELLREYINLGKEKPEGYEDLARYLQAVKECVKDIPLKRKEAEEMVFASDASVLVASIKSQK